MLSLLFSFFQLLYLSCVIFSRTFIIYLGLIFLISSFISFDVFVWLISNSRFIRFSISASFGEISSVSFSPWSVHTCQMSAVGQVSSFSPGNIGKRPQWKAGLSPFEPQTARGGDSSGESRAAINHRRHFSPRERAHASSPSFVPG